MINVKVNFDFIPKTNEDYSPVTYGCIRFVDSYQFLSSSLESFVKTQVDNSHQTLKNLKKEMVANVGILNIFIGIKNLFKKTLYKDVSIKDSKKNFQTNL